MTDNIDPQILSRYTINKKIGQGAYGHVWKAKDNYDGKIVALKKIYDAFRNLQDAQRTYRQVKCFQTLKHTNLVKLYAFHYPDKNKDVYLSIEFMETDLNSLLKQHFLKQIHKGYIFYQVVNAIHYLHSLNIIHRDLKPSNILISNLTEAKLCDFGLIRSLNIKQGEQLLLTENVATKYYRAPQILLGSKYYGKPSDIWSLGCLLLEILTGNVIFKGKTSIDQLESIIQYTGIPDLQKNKKYLTQTSIAIISSFNVLEKKSLSKLIQTNDNQLIELVQGMLKFDPQQRLTINEIRNHSYFDRFKKNIKDIKCSNNLTVDFNDKKWSIQEYKTMLFLEGNQKLTDYLVPFKLKPAISFQQHTNLKCKFNKSLNGPLNVIECQNTKSTLIKNKVNSNFFLNHKSPNNKIYESNFNKKLSPDIKFAKSIVKQKQQPEQVSAQKTTQWSIFSQTLKVNQIDFTNSKKKSDRKQDKQKLLLTPKRIFKKTQYSFTASKGNLFKQ